MDFPFSSFPLTCLAAASQSSLLASPPTPKLKQCCAPESGPRLSSPLACCTLLLIPSFKWHQHISQISLSSCGLSPQLHTLQPSAYLKFSCRCLSVISDLTGPKQKTWFFSSQKSVVLPVCPISANGTFGQPLHWGLILHSLLSVTLPAAT